MFRWIPERCISGQSMPGPPIRGELVGVNDEHLLIDQKSASVVPSEDDVRIWATGRRVFVSSLISDMRDERAAARDAIIEVGAQPVMFEELGGQDVSADRAYLQGVRTSEIYLGLWGPRYGIRMPDGYSATHAEFIEAERAGLRLCLFVRGFEGSEMDGPQKDLIAGIRNMYTTGRWDDLHDLQFRVVQRLRDMAAEEISPWVRVGSCLFRASEIRSERGVVFVQAKVRSKEVAHELERIAGSRSAKLPFAAPGQAWEVQVASVSTRRTSTTTQEIALELHGTPYKQAFVATSYNGISAEKVDRMRVVDGLFGTEELRSLGSWSMVQALDPLSLLRGRGLDDSVLRPVAGLLFEEALLAAGVAERVDSFALGPLRQGARRLAASWVPMSGFGSPTLGGVVTIEGEVTDL